MGDFDDTAYVGGLEHCLNPDQEFKRLAIDLFGEKYASYAGCLRWFDFTFYSGDVSSLSIPCKEQQQELLRSQGYVFHGKVTRHNLNPHTLYAICSEHQPSKLLLTDLAFNYDIGCDVTQAERQAMSAEDAYALVDAERDYDSYEVWLKPRITDQTDGSGSGSSSSSSPSLGPRSIPSNLLGGSR